MTSGKSRKVILCVDDEAIILLSMKTFLINTFGDRFLYETASNGREALEIIHELKEEGKDLFLLITDWVMPVMNGEELINNLNDKYSQLNIVVLTGLMDSSTSQELKQRSDIEAILKKPWRLEELTEIIRNLS